MPGLLRAGRRLRPRQRADQGAPRRRRVGHRRPEGVDLARPPRRLVLRGRPHRARLGAAPRAVLPAGADGPGRRRGPADRAAHRRLGVQRGLLHRRPHRRRPRRRRARRRLEGRDGRCSASSAASPRSASRSASRASSTASSTCAQANGAIDDPVLRDRLAQAQGRARGDAAQRAARPVGVAGEDSPPAAAPVDRQAGLGQLAPAASASSRWTSPAPAGLTAPRRRLRPRRVAAALPVHPRRHDLRRQRRDPAQHPRRARARPAPREARG